MTREVLAPARAHSPSGVDFSHRPCGMNYSPIALLVAVVCVGIARSGAEGVPGKAANFFRLHGGPQAGHYVRAEKMHEVTKKAARRSTRTLGPKYLRH